MEQANNVVPETEMIKRSLSERIGSIKAVQRYTGIIKFFCPES